MYCPSCGKEIPDNSAFCLLCGKPTNVTPATTKKTPTEWIYAYYVISWDIGKGGQYYLGSTNEQVVRLNQWSRDQDFLLPETQKYIDNEWQPVTEIGPSAYIFRKNGNHSEFAAFRVKFRKPKPDKFKPLKKRILGKWQITEVKGRGFNKLIGGIVGLAGKLPKEMSFLPDNTFIFGNFSGLYWLNYDQEKLVITYDQVLDNSIFEIVYDMKWDGKNSLELHAQNNKVNAADIYLRKA